MYRSCSFTLRVAARPHSPCMSMLSLTKDGLDSAVICCTALRGNPYVRPAQDVRWDRWVSPLGGT
jgi:hypothetical protein